MIPEDQVVQAQEVERSGYVIEKFPVTIQAVYQEIMAQSTATIWMVLFAFGIIELIGTFFAKELSLDRDQDSKQHLIFEEDEGLSSTGNDEETAEDMTPMLEMEPQASSRPSFTRMLS